MATDDSDRGRLRLRELARWPLVVAPMAGGPSTAQLVTASAAAGAVGFLAGGYQSADHLRREIRAVRDSTDGAFGVNLFVPGRPSTDEVGRAAYVASLQEDAESLGAELGEAAWDDDAYDEKLDVLNEQPPALVSFTFGCPPRHVADALRGGGALVGITVTNREEIIGALEVSPDFLCLQGTEAGAHRGSFTNDDREGQDVPLLELLSTARGCTDVPLIAAGGITSPGQVVGTLRAGASMVQVGTALVRSTESGANQLYKDALADPRFAESGTTITRAFSGRRARAVVNGFILAHQHAPAAYPDINNATRPLRAAAARRGDPDRLSLYAGTGYRDAKALPAGEIIEELVSGLASGPVPGLPA